MRRDRTEAGISGLGMILSMAGLLAVLLIVAIIVSLTLPSNSNSNTTVTTATTKSTPAAGTNQATSQPTTTASTGLSSTPSASVVAACQSDEQSVQTALAAYQATSGSNATPPAPWSSASYPTNFAPLTNAPAPGPYLKMPPSDTHYVILFDSSGHVWVEPPGTFTPTYNPANDASSASVCGRVAR